MRILGISGSLRAESHNTRLLRAAAAELPPGAELVLFDGLREIPPYDQDEDIEPAHPAVQRLRDEIAAADAVLVATPEFNASIPGVLKNAFDWASRPFPTNSMRGKPFAVIGASTGLFGAVWAQAELRKVIGTAGGDVIEGELPVGLADDAFTADGRIEDPERRRTLTDLLRLLVLTAEPVDEPVVEAA